MKKGISVLWQLQDGVLRGKKLVIWSVNEKSGNKRKYVKDTALIRHHHKPRNYWGDYRPTGLYFRTAFLILMWYKTYSDAFDSAHSIMIKITLKSV